MKVFTRVHVFVVAIISVMLIAGCASPYKDLPVREGTITDSRQSLRAVFKPSVGGAAAGAAVGGVAANQLVGKGTGKKLATVLGTLGGAAAGAVAGGTQEMVPYSQVAFRDDATGEEFRGAVDGQWQVGMRVRFSVAPDGKIILR
jgi:uncharacterized protein YcfJ